MTTLIEVEIISTTTKIPVKLSYVNYMGNRVTRVAGTKAFYRALGIMI